MPRTDTPSEQPDRLKPHLVRPPLEVEISARAKKSSDSRKKLWAMAAEHFEDNDWLE